MIWQLMKIDFLKIKRKGFWFLTFLGPFGVIALQMINYGVRKEYLLSINEDYWGFYLLNVNGFVPLAIVLGIAILTSGIASIENETSAWKQLLALPVTKWKVFLSKFSVLALLFFISCTLLTIFTFLFGIYLNLGSNVPYVDIVTFSFYPYVASLPILALHVWIAIVSNNQAIPVTMGIVGTILTYSAYYLPDWFIWKWPSLIAEWDEPFIVVMLGFTLGVLLFIVGMLDFTRRDVK